MQLNPRERLGYGILVLLLLSIAGVLGYRANLRPRVGSVPPEASRQPLERSSDKVVVNVVGAVVNPGVYTLDAGARAQDAVDAAGGPALDADIEQVDLAAKVTDGQQLRIPEVSLQKATPISSLEGAKKGKLSSGSISLNVATAAELQQLPGIGPATAQKIVDWRTSHGAFSSVDQLRDVGGIGQKRLEQLRPYLRP